MKKVILGLLVVFSGIMMVEAEYPPIEHVDVKNILSGEEYRVSVVNPQLIGNNEVRFYYTSETLEFIDGEPFTYYFGIGDVSSECIIKEIQEGVLSASCTEGDSEGITLNFKTKEEGNAKIGVTYHAAYDPEFEYIIDEFNVIKKDGLCSCEALNNNKCDEKVKCEMECDPCPEVDNTSFEKTNREKNILIGSLAIIVVVELIVIMISLIKKKK
ncbi:MAG: hypothetical protein J6B98_05460 [Bacilli bacterium]|nr:hypothetical protein [Bacilli bacterium]